MKLHPTSDGTVHFQLDERLPSFEITWPDALRMGTLLNAAALVAATWLDVDREIIEARLVAANESAHEKVMEALGADDE